MANNRSGLTLIEMLVAVVITLAGLYLFQHLINPRLNVKTMLMETETERRVTDVANFFANDLREAAPASLDWATIPQAPPAEVGTVYDSIHFWATDLDLANPTVVSTTSVRYFYQPVTGQATGKLVRLWKSSTETTERTVLSYMLPPTASEPLVHQDTTTLRVLAITLRQQPPGQRAVRVVRRTAIRG